jgi:type IV pilus assembly protein PilC
MAETQDRKKPSDAEKPVSLMERLRRRFLKVKLPQKIFFTENLRVMIKAGLSLTEALRTLALQTESKGFRAVITAVQADVEKGVSLSQALGTYPRVFEPIYVNMIAAGEVSGTLEKTLQQLTQQMKKDYELVSKIRGAMTYPAVILGATVAIGIGMMVFVIPQILSIFEEIGTDQLPLPTKILIFVSDFMQHHFIIMALGTVALVTGFLWSIKTGPGMYVWHKFLLKLFVVGPVVKKINLARFSRTLSALLRTDIPIVQSLQITSDIVRNVYYRDALLKAAEAIKKGDQISQVLERNGKLFPPLTVQMIAVGERAGTIDQMLEEIADFYESEVSQVMNNMSSIIEPFLIIFLGAAVGGIALAIITPIYALTTKFGQ